MILPRFCNINFTNDIIDYLFEICYNKLKYADGGIYD